MRAMIDVDDTIADTQVFLLEEINKTVATPFLFDEMTREHREDNDHLDYGKKVWEILKQPQLMAQVKPYPSALDSMWDLWLSGWDLHIVSSRQEPLHTCTRQWLKDHGFESIIEKIHPRPTYTKGSKFKVDVAREVGFTVAFDDTFDVCVTLAAVVPKVYMIDKPWNRGYDDELPNNVIRVNAFTEGVSELLNETAAS